MRDEVFIGWVGAKRLEGWQVKSWEMDSRVVECWMEKYGEGLNVNGLVGK